MADQARVAVLGLGYVGCVTAACLAELGHQVAGVDRDAHKVESVRRGASPFFEPGLEELLRRNVAQGRLTASSNVGDWLPEADVVLICVGTPSLANGDLNLEQLERACREVASHLDRCERPLVVAVRSTVFPGSCEQVVLPAFARYPFVSVVSNPEFLREGSAVRDFFEPSLVVVGGEEPESVRTVARLYEKLPAEVCLVSLRTAEAVKYACNSFHALKIAFANEIGTICERLGIPGDQVMEILCRDRKLNISPAYLKPGFAFGGSCLPKDLRALVYRASRLDLRLPLIESVLPANQEHLRRAMQAALELPARRLGIFGLAFKENTDDLRESPVVSLIEFLIGKGRELRIYDPRIQLDQIYGSNRRFIFEAIPHIERLMVRRWEELAGWADHLVVAQKPDAEHAERLRATALPVLDLVGAFPASAPLAVLAGRPAS
jgi:GDP-mannose 6-dehydrogenase